TVAIAAIVVGIAGATFDIIIDAYRIELLEPRQLGVGSGMSQYGWRIGSAAAGALALVLAARIGWTAAYMACAAFALPAMLVGVFMGEPKRHREPAKPPGAWEALVAYFSPLAEFVRRQAAVGFENFASGIGGVTVVAYLSALCNLRFTATQYALLSALASIAGRFLTATTGGAMITGMGYVNFYLLTTVIALPGVFLFWYMIRSGLADLSIGSAGKESG